jgi:hypothetical protein
MTTHIEIPPREAPDRNAGRNVWRAFAAGLVDDNLSLWYAVDQLRTEVAHLEEQLAARGKVGRPRVPDAVVAEVERLLGEGRSTRAIAAECGVSAMTVSRLARAPRPKPLPAYYAPPHSEEERRYWAAIRLGEPPDWRLVKRGPAPKPTQLPARGRKGAPPE